MLITLTTDFGMQDAYVSIMKGVMARIAPNAPLVDITHTIPPQDVRAAAYLLWTALPYFPEESVHLVVVDPGVGTERRAIAARTAWGALVGPDNGVFSYVWASTPASQIVALENPAYQRPQVSHTFHGRDVFAPAAAHLARGAPLAESGAGGLRSGASARAAPHGQRDAIGGRGAPHRPLRECHHQRGALGVG